MANIMDSVKLRNKPSRNGFDLSFKNNFTAKVGELLPCFMKPVIPGDSYQINLKSFTRLQPVNTAAFVRMREYVDFYFVPYTLLWKYFNTSISQMTFNLQLAQGPLLSDNKPLSSTLPYITGQQIFNYIRSLGKSTVDKNMFGFSRARLTCKLLEYLGYGDYSNALNDGYSINNNLRYSLFPLLAYQKIYADFFRYTQWERTNPSCFNVDYLTCNSDSAAAFPIDLTDVSSGDAKSFAQNYNFFDLRYSNYNKDLFFGVLPNAQFGDSASVSDNLSGYAYTQNFGGDFNTADNAQNELRFLSSDESSSYLTASFSILALRQAEALQRWKEITQSVDEDYKAQIEAHWGVKCSDFLSGQCSYLGGTASSLDINPVVNQNITGSNGADMAGLGTISNNGSIRFQSNGQYGIIMGIYHCTPIYDYACDGVQFDTTLTDVSDYPVPEFDKIGMEQVPSYLLSNPLYNSNAGGVGQTPELSIAQDMPDFLGYAPRYVNWKTSVDVARGAFKGSLKNWVLPMDAAALWAQVANGFTGSSQVGSGGVVNPNVPNTGTSITWPFFKVNPSIVDTLFAVQADSDVDSDQLLVSSFFDCNVVRNLDVNGLPY